MMNPEYANAIVDNMAVTMIRLYGIVLSEYPNALKQAVETLAHEDVRYVQHGNRKIWIGHAAIATELQIDVMEFDVAQEVEPEQPVRPNGTHLGQRRFEVKNVPLTVQDARKQVACTVVVIIDDYLPPSEAVLEDTADLKYERSIQVAFYINS
jgi:hypothetical protein